MDAPGTWFVTKCLTPRRSALADPQAEVIAEALAHYARSGDVLLAAFCVMPDHWHALLHPVRPRRLPDFVGKLDRWNSGRTAAALEAYGCVWQDGYHDTRIRSSRQFRYVIGYIEGNAVGKGLAATAEEWAWSSANPRYSGLMTRPWPWTFETDE